MENNVEMKPVESTHIESVGYDSDKKILTVKFKSESTYDYYPITEMLYEEFMASESKGKYFREFIRENEHIETERK